MKLYGDIISPFVRMCLVTAHEAGIADRIEFINAKVNPTAPNLELAALSPIAKVPVLQTDHGHALHDSRVIIEYLCHVSGNMTIIPDDGVKRFRVLTLQATAQAIADAAVASRYETVARPKELRWTDWSDRLKLRVEMALDDLEDKWQKNLSEVTAGSIATAVVLSYIDLRWGSWEWRKGRPKLDSFHGQFARRDSMVKTPLPPA
jgi:glutathione S-transferase